MLKIELFIIGLIKKIDSFDVQYEFDSINSNYLESGIVILPRFKSRWEGTHTEESHILDINIFVSSMVIFDTKSISWLNEIKIKGHIINPQLFSTTISEENSINTIIGVSPVNKNIKLNVKEIIDSDQDKTKFFEAMWEEDYNEDLKQNILSIIRELDNAQCDIVVFPELLGSKEIDEYIINALDKTSTKNIKIIVLPSYYREHDGKVYNSSTIVNWDGEIVFQQDKMFRYSLKDGATEYVEKGKYVHILYMYGIGEIAVLICRSFLEKEIKELLFRLKIKLILCPSWSSGNLDFINSAMAGAETDCNSAWINTCSAVSNDKGRNPLAIITSYTRNKSYDGERIGEFTSTEMGCNKKCDGSCFAVGKIMNKIFEEKEMDTYDE